MKINLFRGKAAFFWVANSIIVVQNVYFGVGNLTLLLKNHISKL